MTAWVSSGKAAEVYGWEEWWGVGCWFCCLHSIRLARLHFRLLLGMPHWCGRVETGHSKFIYRQRTRREELCEWEMQVSLVMA